MLHHGQKNHVAIANEFSAPGLRHEIDAFSRPAGEDDLICTSRADVFCNTLPRFLISLGRTRAQHMQPAMHIRVVVFVKIPQRLDHGARFLRGRSAIEIDQRMSVRLLAQNREIFAKRTPVDSAGSDLVHITICYTCRRAPLHSQRATKR